jgi:hypothetical protein
MRDVPVRQGCFSAFSMPSGGWFIIIGQPRDVKKTGGNQDGRDGNEARLGAGLFQILGQFVRQKAHLAVKDFHLP